MFSKLQVHLSRAQSRRLLHEADCWQPSQALLPELDPNLLLLVQALGEPSQTIGMSRRNNGRRAMQEKSNVDLNRKLRVQDKIDNIKRR